MEKDKEIEVRDLREKFFLVDDTYLNGWAKKCGEAATLVYMILCRHSSRDQSCFPSYEFMADRLGIRKRRVIRGIKTLEFFHIIETKRSRGERNIYWLLDKSQWCDPTPKPVIKRGPAKKATKAEKTDVKVTYDGPHMRPMKQRGKKIEGWD